MTEFVLATSYYARWRPDDGVPVQCSIGAPQWWQGPPLADLRSTAPWGLKDVLDDDEFRRKYRARLHRQTNRIVRELTELADSYPGTPLILMCFERDRGNCHRLQLAEWLSERLDVEVPEVTLWD